MNHTLASAVPNLSRRQPSLLAMLFTRSRSKSDVLRAARIRMSRLGGPVQVDCDLDDRLPVHKGEIALLRAFLADEINAILFGREEP
jgi:hypothetical protein